MRYKRVISLFCAVICMMSVVVSASARASDQIRSYVMHAKSDDGNIYVNFSVAGKDGMDLIGCESIYIYDRSSGDLVESFDENDTGMSRSNTAKYSNMITADCEVGTPYRVEVTIFAEDSAGRDTRSQTFYVTGQA